MCDVMSDEHNRLNETVTSFLRESNQLAGESSFKAKPGFNKDLAISLG